MEWARRCCAETSPGCCDQQSWIVPELTPVMVELIVLKTVPSAFFGTSLAAWLAERGAQTLAVAGTVTSGCARKRG